MKKRLEWISLIAISALAALPLCLNPGFLNTRGGGDSPFLLFRLHQLYTALTQGVFPVRWMPEAAFGLGYPFFNYYASLPLYLAAGFKLFGASYVAALKLTHLSGFLLAAVAMYGWLRSIEAKRSSAWLAATAYTFAPFHFVNVFVRGDSLNEFWAFAFYPLCLWAARRLALQPALARGLLLALAYAALLLTHNISALIFSPFLALYLIVGARNGSPSAGRFVTSILLSAAFILLGLALSAFFWLPALRESEFGQLAPVTSGYFHYANHFRGRTLVQASLLFNYDTGNAGTTPFAMGLVQSGLVALGLIALAIQLWQAFRRRDSDFIRQRLFLVGGLLLATFMVTRLSEGLWANLPLLPFVQFPWRFLSVQSLFASTMIGLIVDCGQSTLNSQPTNHPPLITVYRLLATGLLALACILPVGLSLRPDFIPITEADVTPERLQTYEYFTGNIGTTINYEYLPRWTQPRPYASEEYLRGPEGVHLKVLGGEAAGERLAKRAAAQTWQITVNTQTASLAVPLLYWPGWGAAVNGQPLDIHPAEGLGWIAFDLPQGEHTVEFKLGDTDVRRNATLVSALALLITLALAQPWRLPARILVAGTLVGMTIDDPFGRRTIENQPSSIVRRPSSNFYIRAVALLLALAALAIAGRLINARAQPVGAATMDFDQHGYLYSSAVTFGNGDVLLGYNYSAETLQPGDHLGLALQWQAQNKATFTLDLLSPAGHLLKLPQVVAASVSGLAEGRAGALLRIPDDIPTGVYLLRLTLTQAGNLYAPALTSNNQPRGPLYLRPVRIFNPNRLPPQSPTPLTTAIALAGVTSAQTDSTAATITPHWQALASVPANYLLALRLHDAADFELAALDVQPTGGIYPTSAWQAGEVVPDPYRLPLPAGLPPGNYPLTLTLYDAATLTPAGTATVPILLSHWSPPPGTEPLHRFTDTLALHDATLPATAHAGDRFSFTVQWISMALLPQDLLARWSAVSHTGEVTAFADQPLGVIPNSQWAAGALVMGRPSIKLPISAVPGEYTLNIQLLNPAGEILSPAVAVGKVTVIASDRTTTLPAMHFESGADFGPIRLAGYDAAVTAEALRLTLHWQAAEVPTADYKYFVHLFNPADEAMAAQSDGFPAIPTSQWEKDEVVSVTVSLPLDDLTPETVYNLGVGWYEPTTGNRLGDRVILNQGVVKP